VSRICIPIEDGKVACPYRGSVDVEICYRCPHLRAFFDEESGTKAVCSTPNGVVHRLVAYGRGTWTPRSGS
jgi:hypothetical protein